MLKKPEKRKVIVSIRNNGVGAWFVPDVYLSTGMVSS